MQVANALLVIAVFAFMSLAGIWDARTRRIPNWITVPALLLGILFHLVSGAIGEEPWYSGAGRGLLFSTSGFAVGFVPLFLLWILRFGGAGDVKLMAAVGAWLGPQLTFYTYILSTLLLAASTLTFVMFRAFAGSTVAADTGGGQSSSLTRDKKLIVPYGVPVAASTCVIVIWKFVLMPG